MASSIRPPRWAGSFYPGNPDSLRSQIQDLHTQAVADKIDLGNDKLRALVLPHAGYIYSGFTAAHGTIQLQEHQFQTVFLLGPAHHVGVVGSAVSSVTSYRTPLGDIPLSAMGERLQESHPDLFQENLSSEQAEHSLEVILPFLQESLGDFSLMPLVVGQTDTEKTAQALAPLLTEDALVVISSDLSHFLDYDVAVKKDKETLDAILAMDMASLLYNDNKACGMVGIQILLGLARLKNWQPRLLHYSNSGDTSGDRSRVVGYGAIAFTENVQ
ncbi:MAG: AmmeMemoRadiSam system protein B [Thermodesulfobacteriota bacterium]